jgi:hypothetical protein
MLNPSIDNGLGSSRGHQLNFDGCWAGIDKLVHKPPGSAACTFFTGAAVAVYEGSRSGLSQASPLNICTRTVGQRNGASLPATSDELSRTWANDQAARKTQDPTWQEIPSLPITTTKVAWFLEYETTCGTGHRSIHQRSVCICCLMVLHRQDPRCRRLGHFKPSSLQYD